MDRERILANLEAVSQGLLSHARDPAHPPMLLPVTKTRPLEDVLALRGSGIKAIGENRAQDILEKFPAVSGDFGIHMIGRLQTNKIKYIIGRVCLMHALDRQELAEAIHAKAGDAGISMPVLIQVNIGGESQKAGLPPDGVTEAARAWAKLSGLSVRGLMAMMPRAEDPETLRPLFRRMRTLFERLRNEAMDGVLMEELSMGMSGDYLVAAEEGATIVRVGSAIFGDRA